jgi:hypothetical protein
MFDVDDDAKAEFRRVEVPRGTCPSPSLVGGGKGTIVEETQVPGARVSEVARRSQVCSQQRGLLNWRTHANARKALVP